MDDYRRASHCKYSLKVHLIFVTKYRKKILKFKNISDDIKQYIFEKCSLLNCNIIQIEDDIDHIHILVEYPAYLSVSELIKSLKEYSTYKVWKKYSGLLSRHYWKKKIFWSDGYFACSIGQVSQSTIEKYIANQG